VVIIKYARSSLMSKTNQKCVLQAKLNSRLGFVYIRSGHGTGNNIKGPNEPKGDQEVMSFDWKSPGIGCRRPISQVLSTFELLQGCNSQEVAVT